MKGDEINVEMIEDTEVINCAMDNNGNMHDAANADAAKRDLIAERLQIISV